MITYTILLCVPYSYYNCNKSYSCFWTLILSLFCKLVKELTSFIYPFFNLSYMSSTSCVYRKFFILQSLSASRMFLLHCSFNPQHGLCAHIDKPYKSVSSVGDLYKLAFYVCILELLHFLLCHCI